MQQLPELGQMGRVVQSVSRREGKSCLHTTKCTHTLAASSLSELKSSYSTYWRNLVIARRQLSWTHRFETSCYGSRETRTVPHVCVHPCIIANFPHSRRARNSFLRDVWEWQEFLEAEGVDRNRASMTWTPWPTSWSEEWFYLTTCLCCWWMFHCVKLLNGINLILTLYIDFTRVCVNRVFIFPMV